MTDQITLNVPVYTEEDHQTWTTLYARQLQRVQGVACHAFLTGLPLLALDPHRLPDPRVYSDRLRGMTGWTLGDAQNAYLGPTEWFEHLAECRFPVTNYIRKPHEIEFTPLPDLFHEYFGHLAFFTDQYYSDTAQMFGQLYLAAHNQRQQLAIARLWWFTTEFGLIREDGDLKIFGAGLLSSPGELAHALDSNTPHIDFDIQRVADTASTAYGYHPQYFVIEEVADLRRIIAAYADMEGLRQPVPLR